MIWKEIKCDSCEVLVINNVICHERNCPDAWKDYFRECKWCGNEFKPKEKDQYFCEASCSETYYS
jgi:hypothetical protein